MEWENKNRRLRSRHAIHDMQTWPVEIRRRWKKPTVALPNPSVALVYTLLKKYMDLADGVLPGLPAPPWVL